MNTKLFVKSTSILLIFKSNLLLKLKNKISTFFVAVGHISNYSNEFTIIH